MTRLGQQRHDEWRAMDDLAMECALDAQRYALSNANLAAMFSAAGHAYNIAADLCDKGAPLQQKMVATKRAEALLDEARRTECSEYA